MFVYQLRSANTAAAQKLMSEYFMGQEDGMYPDAPGWGPPSPMTPRSLRRAYAKQYRWGYNLHRLTVAATLEQLEAGLTLLVHHHGQEWQSLDDPVRIVAGIEMNYRRYNRTRKGWKGFVRDVAAAQQSARGRAPYPHSVAPSAPRATV